MTIHSKTRDEIVTEIEEAINASTGMHFYVQILDDCATEQPIVAVLKVVNEFVIDHYNWHRLRARLTYTHSTPRPINAEGTEYLKVLTDATMKSLAELEKTS